MNNWRDISISPELSVLDAMKIINGSGTQFVMVMDSSDKLLGVVTDGDIRRGILNNIPLSAPVHFMMNTNPRTLPNNTSVKDAFRFLEENFIFYVPLIDKDGRVKKVISIHEKNESDSNNLTAVLMVGGLGSRLGELTANCPKPMLPVGGKPVLELIVENLKEHGFKDFVFCVNYKAEVIQNHFGNGSEMGIKVRYVHEEKRMGTAGALSLLPQSVSDTFLVMNGDIVTKVNFTRFLDFHRETRATATMGVRKYDIQIPFGVVKTDQSRITAIEEKPLHTFLVNAGIYIVEKSCMKFLPQGEHFDMPSLFEALMSSGEFTQAFPIHEYWLDIGREDDLVKAQKEFMSKT